MLGDEGSGWSLGREGIKSVLTYTANSRPLLPWHRDILERFGVVDEPHRLLTALTTLDPGLPVNVADSERKKRIAACTKDVVQAALGGDDEALVLLRRVAAEVVDLLRPLVDGVDIDHDGDQEIKTGPKDTILVVGGGLANVDAFWDIVESGMKAEDWEWAMVRRVDEAALEGIKVVMDDKASLGA